MRRAHFSLTFQIGSLALGVLMSGWLAFTAYQSLGAGEIPGEPQFYYRPGAPDPLPLLIEVDRMVHAPSVGPAAERVVISHLRPLGIEVRWVSDEVIPDSVPLNRYDAERLLARWRGNRWGLWRDRRRYDRGLHLILATTGGGAFRSGDGRRYIHGVTYREHIFFANGRSTHPSEGLIVFTFNIADALRRAQSQVTVETWQRAIGEAISHEIGHAIGFTHAMHGFMDPLLNFDF